MNLPRKRPVGPVQISTTSYEEMVALCLHWAKERRNRPSAEAHYVCVTSAHGVILAKDDAGFADHINSADVATPDGMPIVWALRSFGETGQQRVYGPTLMLFLCEMAALEGLRVFLYGSLDETLQALSINLKEKFPALQIAGVYSPPFRPLTSEEDADVCELIQQSNSDFVFVGMGTPKQEQWMREHRKCFPGVTMIGVGAAFDFHAGRTRQAPVWVQSHGFEWLFRLLMEPLRLWRRYLLVTPRFLPLWFAEWWKSRSRNRSNAKIATGR